MQEKTIILDLEPEADGYSNEVTQKLVALMLKDFFSQFRAYFQNIAVGDLGCGPAFPRKILTSPEYNCTYIGIDDPSLSCSPFKTDADISWDITQGPRDKEMVFDAALWFQPSDFRQLNVVKDYVKQRGLLAFQAGEYMFNQWNVEAVISKYFAVLEKIKYSANAVKSVSSIDDVFLIGRKL